MAKVLEEHMKIVGGEYLLQSCGWWVLFAELRDRFSIKRACVLNHFSDVWLFVTL